MYTKKTKDFFVTISIRKGRCEQSRDPTRSFNGAASNRVVAKSAGLIYKGFGLQAATLPFPRRDPRRITVHDRGKVSFAYAAVQFPRDVSISVGRRAPFRCIQFRGAPFIPPSRRDTYRQCQIPLFSIRWWINPSYPKLSCCLRLLYTLSSEA